MFTIRQMSKDDGEAVLQIYAQGIATGNATFETEAGSWEKFDKRFHPEFRLVATDNEKVTGWAVLAPTSIRECYKGVLELSIFIREHYRGKGIAKKLMGEIIDLSESKGIWTLQSLIHSDNLVSIRMHEQFGFRIVGYRERIAMLNGKWKTNVLMERRSKIVGN